MSDKLAGDAHEDGNGYLTGYSLGNAGAYVLARTWRAPEMPRPGCVWTHSFLVDFADLAVIDCVGALLELFRYPRDLSAAAFYSLPIVVDSKAQPTLLTDTLIYSAGALVEKLYGHPEGVILVSGLPVKTLEELTLAIWEQQWPRLRRSFSFCVGGTYGTSLLDHGFDLIGVIKPPRVRLPKEVQQISPDDRSDHRASWVEACIKDLAANASGRTLRGFLREYAADISLGRSAFPALVSIYELTSRTGVADRVCELLNALPLSESEGKRLKEHVVRVVVNDIENVGTTALTVLGEHAALLTESDLQKSGARIASRLWRSEPKIFWRFLSAGASHSETLLGHWSEVDESDARAILSSAPDVLAALIEKSPTLPERAVFWRALGVNGAALIEALPSEGPRATRVIHAMCESRVNSLAGKAIEHFGSERVSDAFLAHISAKKVVQKEDGEWIELLCRHDAEFLRSSLGMREFYVRPVLQQLVTWSNPDSPAQTSKDDPWAAAFEAIGSRATSPSDLALGAFAVTRAFGFATREKGRLLRWGLDAVYAGLYRSTLPYALWAPLDARLPTLFSWLDWDRCERIRRGIRALCEEGELTPVEFAGLTDDVEFFRDYTRAVRSMRGGIQFLERVLPALERRGSRKAAFRSIVRAELPRKSTRDNATRRD